MPAAAVDPVIVCAEEAAPVDETVDDFAVPCNGLAPKLCFWVTFTGFTVGVPGCTCGFGG